MITVAWLAGQFAPHAPGFWLVLDLVAGALFWLGLRYIPLRARPLATAARWVAVPYLGLIFGGLSPRLMGLAGINWVVSLGLGVGLLFAMVALLTLVRVAFAVPAAETGAPLLSWPARIYSIFDSGAEEFHWAFLRGALAGIALAAPTAGAVPGSALYWAVWLAALLALPETLRVARSGPARLLKVVTLLATTVLFLYVPNFWLCWLLHAAVMLVASTIPAFAGAERDYAL
jgi:hypothetical protein